VVAATDFELEPYGELIREDWTLRVRYDFPTIIREAIEQQLAAKDSTEARAEAV
jgi:hypothetical protein